MKHELEEVQLLVGIQDLLDRIEQSPCATGGVDDTSIATLAVLHTLLAILKMPGSAAAQPMCQWMVIWIDEVRDAPGEIKARTEALVARIAK